MKNRAVDRLWSFCKLFKLSEQVIGLNISKLSIALQLVRPRVVLIPAKVNFRAKPATTVYANEIAKFATSTLSPFVCVVIGFETV